MRKGQSGRGIVYVIAVIIPAVVLSFISLRSVRKEESYIEQQLKDSFNAELSQIASRIRIGLGAMKEQLYDPEEGSERAGGGTPFRILEESLVSFTLKEGEIIGAEGLDMPLGRYAADLIASGGEVAVFENVALAFKDVILTDHPEEAVSEEMQVQQALNLFEEDQDIQEKVYSQAEEEGKKVLSRTITSEDKRSRYITYSRSFGELTGFEDAGIIPITFEERVYLLYWLMESSGELSAGVADMDRLRGWTVGQIGKGYSEVRIINILDEQGNPLIDYPAAGDVDWSAPAVSLELSELMSGWELAAYYTDPGIISIRARTTRVIP